MPFGSQVTRHALNACALILGADSALSTLWPPHQIEKIGFTSSQPTMWVSLGLLQRTDRMSAVKFELKDTQYRGWEGRKPTLDY